MTAPELPWALIGSAQHCVHGPSLTCGKLDFVVFSSKYCKSVCVTSDIKNSFPPLPALRPAPTNPCQLFVSGRRRSRLDALPPHHPLHSTGASARCRVLRMASDKRNVSRARSQLRARCYFEVGMLPTPSPLRTPAPLRPPERQPGPGPGPALTPARDPVGTDRSSRPASCVLLLLDLVSCSAPGGCNLVVVSHLPIIHFFIISLIFHNSHHTRCAVIDGGGCASRGLLRRAGGRRVWRDHQVSIW